MNLFFADNSHKIFGLDITITESDISFQPYTAYNTTSLKQYWSMLVSQSNVQTPMGQAPTPDVDPLWVTETYTVFDAVGSQKLYPAQTISFEDIKNSNDFSDHGLYLIYAPHSAHMVYTGSQKPQAGTFPFGTLPVPLANAFGLTAGTKLHPLESVRQANNDMMIAIVVPFADAPVDQWSIVIKAASTDLVRIKSGQSYSLIHEDTTEPERNNGSLKQSLEKLLPKVVFDEKSVTVGPDGSVDVAFHLENGDGTVVEDNNAVVYLKTNAGSLNKTQVKTQAGHGYVKVTAAYLEKGDQFKVSAGFKYVSGLDDCIVTVI